MGPVSKIAIHTDDTDHDEVALVERARAGQEDAFRCLVERHSDELFRLAYRLTGERASADDAVQESWLKAWRALRDFDGRSRFTTWMHRITANCALDRLRRRQRRAPIETAKAAPEMAELTATTDPDPLRRTLSAETRRRIEQGLARLTPLERTAFVLRHFEGCSIAEIGRQLGSGQNATKQAVFRAVHKLRRELEPLHFEPEESRHAEQIA